MTTIRELIAEMGFKVDTTGASRFDAAINRSRKNLEGLNTVSLAGLVKTATKAFAIITTVATAGSLAAAKKFADIETSLEALKFATGESFALLKKEIDDILRDKVLKNLVDEIDLVNAALGEAQEKGVKGETITKFLRLAALLAVQAKKPINEVLRLITGFTVEGDLGIFKLLKELPPELQELFKAAGISPAKAGFIARGEKVRESLKKVEAELERNIIEQRERGLTTFKELDVALNKLTKEIGRNTLPAFKDLNDRMIPLIETLTLFTGVEVGPEKEKKTLGRIVLEALFPRLSKVLTEKKTPQEIAKTAAGEFIEETKRRFGEARKRGFQPKRSFQTFPIPNITRRNNQNIANPANTPNQTITISVPITIEAGASADPVVIKQAVNEGIRDAMGAVKEQNNAATLRRGGD